MVLIAIPLIGITFSLVDTLFFQPNAVFFVEVWKVKLAT